MNKTAFINLISESLDIISFQGRMISIKEYQIKDWHLVAVKLNQNQLQFNCFLCTIEQYHQLLRNNVQGVIQDFKFICTYSPFLSYPILSDVRYLHSEQSTTF
jgi:hypothetical protein